MYIHVHVQTGARRESLVRRKDGHYEISVKVKPQQNAANHRVLEMLAHALQIPIAQIRFVSGQKSPKKLFQIV